MTTKPPTSPVVIPDLGDRIFGQDEERDEVPRRTWERGLPLLASLLDDLEIPVIGVITPAGLQNAETPEELSRGLDELPATGLPLLDLGAREVPDLPRIRRTHPYRAEYEWYAATLAADLLAPVCPARASSYGPGSSGPCLPALAAP
jgi:hypothetical protein